MKTKFDSSCGTLETLTTIDEKTEYIKKLSDKLDNSISFGLIERSLIEDFTPRNRKERRHGRKG